MLLADLSTCLALATPCAAEFAKGSLRARLDASTTTTFPSDMQIPVCNFIVGRHRAGSVLAIQREKPRLERNVRMAVLLHHACRSQLK